jgi:hypothetical protein
MDDKAAALEATKSFGDSQKEAITPHKIAIFTLIKTFGEMKLAVLCRKQDENLVQSMSLVLKSLNYTSYIIKSLVVCKILKQGSLIAADPFEDKEKKFFNPKFRKTFCMMVLKLLQVQLIIK